MFYVDGAHNPGAVRQIYNSLADSDKEWLLLFAVCSDKDYTEMIRILGKIPWKRIYITKIDSARGADTAAVRQCFEEAAGCPICELRVPVRHLRQLYEIEEMKRRESFMSWLPVFSGRDKGTCSNNVLKVRIYHV